MYSFPPFFTKQPNALTWAHQSEQWIALILSYWRFHRLYSLNFGSETCEKDIFRNSAIERKLDLSTLHLLVEKMVERGQAEYFPRTNPKSLPTGAYIYWRRPEDWSNLIYTWVKSKGLENTVMTVYELTAGNDQADSIDFRHLPDPLVRKALEVLIRAGKAQLLRGTGGGEDGEGVKFI